MKRREFFKLVGASVVGALLSTVKKPTEEEPFATTILSFADGPTYVWNRQLSQQEIRSIHENPYQMFKPAITTGC